MPTLQKTGKDRFRVLVNTTEYLLEVQERYEDVWYEVTKNGKPVSQEEHDAVMQVYWEQ